QEGAEQARRAGSLIPLPPNTRAQPPSGLERQYTTKRRPGRPVGCSARILMKALMCDDGDGTQPPPPHVNPEAFSCVPSSRPPTPDSMPASISTPGPSSSSSSTTTARSASPKTCPPTPTPSSAPSLPSDTGSSSP